MRCVPGRAAGAVGVSASDARETAPGQDLSPRTHAEWYAANFEPTFERRATPGGTELLLSRQRPLVRLAAPPLAVLTLQVARGTDRHELDLGEGRFEARLDAHGSGFVVAPAAHANFYDISGEIELLAIDLPDWVTVDDHGEAVRALPGLHGRMLSDPVIEGIARRFWALTGAAPQIELDSLTITLFALLKRLREELPPLPRGGLARWQERRVIDYLRDHLAEDTGIPELAALVGLSPFHFARQFRASTGLPPVAYQRRLRVERAQELLMRTELSVTEIAFATGYDSSQAFARAFRQAVGASPSEWRRDRRR